MMRQRWATVGVLPGVLVLAFAVALLARDSRAASLCLVLAGLAWWALSSEARARIVGVGPLFWTVALGLRLLAAFAGPQFSDDVYRYAWEGEVVRAGKSPYAFAPLAPELAEIRERRPDLAARVNHPEVPAAYPPLVQLCGTLAAASAASSSDPAGRVQVLGLRFLFLLADLGVLVWMLRGRSRGWLSAAAPVVWGWSPLVCLEFAGSGHLDSFGILLLCGTLLGLEARSRWAALACALGAGVKYLPLCLLPWIARRRGAVLAGACVATTMALFLPVLALEGGARGLGAGLHEYGTRWEASSLVYRWVERGLGGEDPRPLARTLLAGAWLLIAGWTSLRIRDPWRGGSILIGAFLVLSPTLHPWYLTWMLPFLAHERSPAWSWLAASVPLFYWPLDEWQARSVWPEPAWIWWAVTPAFGALLLAGAFSRRVPVEEAQR